MDIFPKMAHYWLCWGEEVHLVRLEFEWWYGSCWVKVNHTLFRQLAVRSSQVIINLDPEICIPYKSCVYYATSGNLCPQYGDELNDWLLNIRHSNSGYNTQDRIALQVWLCVGMYPVWSNLSWAVAALDVTNHKCPYYYIKRRLKMINHFLYKNIHHISEAKRSGNYHFLLLKSSRSQYLQCCQTLS